MNENSTIYALRGARGDDPFTARLQKGEGCFGWSFVESADLRQLQKKIVDEGWGALSEDEQNCYQAFLLGFKKDDYAIFINTPKYGECTLARITGEYYWKWDGDRGDFNHRFPIDPASIVIFHRNDKLVHPSLSRRLKLQGRWWSISDHHQNFEALIVGIKGGKEGGMRTPESNRKLLHKAIQPLLDKITKKIHETHPNKDLEALLEIVFNKIPCVKNVERKGGRGDLGADLLVYFETDLPIPPQTCVVQVKSFTGTHGDTRAVSDIERAFLAYPTVNIGLIVSTASASTDVLDKAVEDLETKTGKSVSLLVGNEVAEFVLRFLD